MLNQRLASPRVRKRRVVTEKAAEYITVNGERLINFASNDYLGLSQHARVKTAFKLGIDQYGVGSGSAVTLAGYTQAVQELEQAFAQYLGYERALLLNSGYHANLAVLTTFADRHTHIIADKLCHASIIDGCLLSRAQFSRYAHNDLIALRDCLDRHTAHRRLVVSETLFSMEGDIAPLAEIRSLCTSQQAMLAMDNAHGLGVLPHSPIADILVNPLGKAFGGMGAIVAGSQTHIQSMIQFARPYLYSTALPPAIAVAGLTALQILQEETWRTQRLLQLVAYFNQQCQALGVPLMSMDNTPIRAVLVKHDSQVLQLQDICRQQGFYVPAIMHPTVPEGLARLRLSLNVHHQEKQIDRLIGCLC